MGAPRRGWALLGATTAVGIACAFACSPKGGSGAAPSDTGVPVVWSAPAPVDQIDVPPSAVPTVEGLVYSGWTDQVAFPGADAGAAACPASWMDCGDAIGRAGERACCPANTVCDNNEGSFGPICRRACPADHPDACFDSAGPGKGPPSYETPDAGASYSPVACCLGGACGQIGTTRACKCPSATPNLSGTTCSASPVCPADHPGLCGTNCCGPGFVCDPSRGGCACLATSVCGAGCCGAGSQCSNGQCVLPCPADHPVSCGAMCCGANQYCDAAGRCASPPSF